MYGTWKVNCTAPSFFAWTVNCTEHFVFPLTTIVTILFTWEVNFTKLFNLRGQLFFALSQTSLPERSFVPSLSLPAFRTVSVVPWTIPFSIIINFLWRKTTLVVLKPNQTTENLHLHTDYTVLMSKSTKLEIKFTALD